MKATSAKGTMARRWSLTISEKSLASSVSTPTTVSTWRRGTEMDTTRSPTSLVRMPD